MDIAYVLPNQAPTQQDVMDHLRSWGSGPAPAPRGRRRSRPLRKNQRRIVHNPYIHLGTSGRTGPFFITTGEQGGTNYQVTGYYQDYPHGYPDLGAVLSLDEVKAKYHRFPYMEDPVKAGSDDRESPNISALLASAVRFASIGRPYEDALRRAKERIDSSPDARVQMIGETLYLEALEDIANIVPADLLAAKADSENRARELREKAAAVDVDALRHQASLDEFALQRGGIIGKTLYASGQLGTPVQTLGTKVVETSDVVVDVGKNVVAAGEKYLQWQRIGLAVVGLGVLAYAYRQFVK